MRSKTRNQLHATRELPNGYTRHATLDLSQQKMVGFGLSVLVLLLLIIATWMLTQILPLLRPDLGEFRFSLSGLDDILLLLVNLVLPVALMVVLHEGIHGLLFRRYTGAQPVFGFKLLYAYAAAPGWYLPRNHYIVVALGPLILITLLILLLTPFVPEAALWPLLLIMLLNIAGAAGDIVVTAWLLTRPASSLVEDRGDAVTVYE